LVDGSGTAPRSDSRLLSARAWPTPVPAEAFKRITGKPAFPRDLEQWVDGDSLSYLCNAELGYQVGGVIARSSARWDLAAPSGGGDSSRVVAHGTLADICLEQGAHTGHRRRLSIEPRSDPDGVATALRETVTSWQAEFPGVRVEPGGGHQQLLAIPAPLDTGHESHFAQVLDEFLRAIDEHRWPAERARRTLDKYALLARAAAQVSLPAACPCTPCD
jgi:hypothetical protein